jgi:hypothetical protein
MYTANGTSNGTRMKIVIIIIAGIYTVPLASCNGKRRYCRESSDRDNGLYPTLDSRNINFDRLILDYTTFGLESSVPDEEVMTLIAWVGGHILIVNNDTRT